MSDRTSSNATYTPKSDYSYYKDFGGYNNFMASHGLKVWDHNGVQEGKAIIDSFKEQDRYEWEQQQIEKGSK